MGKDGLFPFAFSDIMGLEEHGGVLENDIISALKGHIKEGYTVRSKLILRSVKFTLLGLADVTGL